MTLRTMCYDHNSEEGQSYSGNSYGKFANYNLTTTELFKNISNNYSFNHQAPCLLILLKGLFASNFVFKKIFICPYLDLHYNGHFTIIHGANY